ncbi:MAG: hypothetical protein E7290_06595 [Lachnospiraceae bacterium]|nr:hypothetical protein [Lachnospiraceae bacterium]
MFQIKMFGYFRMTRKGQVLDEGSIHSTILIKLLVFMLLNRDRVLTNIELERHLWKPQEIENPADALKNLMYRLRKALQTAFGEGNYILTGRGNYRWNPEHAVELDTELFEQAYEKARDVDSKEDERLIQLERSIEIYEGMFLANIENDYWISNQSMFYHSRYLYLMEKLLVYYWEQEDYEAVERYCTQGLAIDEYDEAMNLYKMKALSRMGKERQAEKFFYSLEQNVKNGLGVNGIELIRNMKRELQLEERTNEISRQELQRALTERAAVLDKKSVICDFEEFKFLYALQARKNARRQEEGYIILLTVELNDDLEVNPHNVEDYLLQFAMDGVGKVLENYLREFDIVTKCSNCQYIIMLDRCSYNNSIKVAQRMLKRYESTAGTRFVKLVPDIHKITMEVE